MSTPRARLSDGARSGDPRNRSQFLRRLLKDVALNLALASKTRLAIGPDPAEGNESQEDITSPRGSDIYNTMKLKSDALKRNVLFFDSKRSVDGKRPPPRPVARQESDRPAGGGMNRALHGS